METTHHAPGVTIQAPGAPSKADAARVSRWLARSWQWENSQHERCRKCGRVPVAASNAVQVRANGRAVGYAGLATCGSIWACPVCNSKIQAVRRLEVHTALLTALDGGGAAFGAYTLRHGPGMPLDALWRALSTCWASVQRDRSVRALRASYGHVGFVRAGEVTLGGNGWHPHLHPLHFFAAPVSDREVEHLRQAEFAAWQSAALRLGLEAPEVYAQNLQVVRGHYAADELGRYFAKVTWEVTSTQTKSDTRAGGSVTPWQLLRYASEEGDEIAAERWSEWESDSKGKRALTWSQGLRKRVGLDLEATDETIAAAEVGTREDTGFIITDWTPVARNPRIGAQLLNVIGAGQDWDAGRRFARAHGLDVRDA